jgi:hypothetical protein
VPATIKRSGIDASWTQESVRHSIETACEHRKGLRRLS